MSLDELLAPRGNGNSHGKGLAEIPLQRRNVLDLGVDKEI
jgi:hypothetical protein